MWKREDREVKLRGLWRGRDNWETQKRNNWKNEASNDSQILANITC